MTPMYTIIESPYAAPTILGRYLNRKYARECLRDSLERGELPYASHLLYPQVLDDTSLREREQGIKAGFEWAALAMTDDGVRVFYMDRGMSAGMKRGLEHANRIGQRVIYRYLGRPWSKEAYTR